MGGDIREMYRVIRGIYQVRVIKGGFEVNEMTIAPSTWMSVASLRPSFAVS